MDVESDEGYRKTKEAIKEIRLIVITAYNAAVKAENILETEGMTQEAEDVRKSNAVVSNIVTQKLQWQLKHLANMNDENKRLRTENRKIFDRLANHYMRFDKLSREVRLDTRKRTRGEMEFDEYDYGYMDPITGKFLSFNDTDNIEIVREKIVEMENKFSQRLMLYDAITKDTMVTIKTALLAKLIDDVEQNRIKRIEDDIKRQRVGQGFSEIDDNIVAKFLDSTGDVAAVAAVAASDNDESDDDMNNGGKDEAMPKAITIVI